MAWLARGDFTGSDYVQASDLNNLHNDDVTWGGNVNGGGYTLSNVILEGVVTQSGASGVSSFNTRIGAVVSQSGDYTAAMVGAVPTSLQILTPRFRPLRRRRSYRESQPERRPDQFQRSHRRDHSHASRY